MQLSSGNPVSPIGLPERIPQNPETAQEENTSMLLVFPFAGFLQVLPRVGKVRKKAIVPHRRMIGEAIRRCRKDAGFTQEALAEKIDLNPKYIGEVERGEKIISIEALLRLAKVVKIPMSDFFRGL